MSAVDYPTHGVGPAADAERCRLRRRGRVGRRRPVRTHISGTTLRRHRGEPEGPDQIAAPAPDTAQTRRRFRGQFGYVGLEHVPRRQRRWEKSRELRRKQAGVSFTEFAGLNDGQRAILRSDRGLNWSSSHSPDPWHGVTQESLADEVRGYLAAEEEDCCPISPDSVVELVRRYYDIEVDAPSVEAALKLPRRVEFGAPLLTELSRHATLDWAILGPAGTRVTPPLPPNIVDPAMRALRPRTPERVDG